MTELRAIWEMRRVLHQTAAVLRFFEHDLCYDRLADIDHVLSATQKFSDVTTIQQMKQWEEERRAERYSCGIEHKTAS